MTPLVTRRYRTDDAAAIERLNQRFTDAAVPHRVYPEGRWGDSPDGPVRSRLFVATDDDGVHGGVWLQEQDFWAGGRVVPAGWAKYPVSESLIDARYGGVAGGLIFRLLKEQPVLMALGMGGWDTPFAQLLARLQWTGWSVPLYVALLRPGRALRELARAQRSAARRLLMRLAAATGTGWLGARAVTLWRAAGSRARDAYTAEVVGDFGEWADGIWAAARETCAFAAVRDARALNAVFRPRHRLRTLTRLRVRRAGDDVGWACVTLEDLRDDPDPRFGRLVVGLLADGLALPGHTAGVANAAVRHLAASGADLVISNQNHRDWCAALRGLGFLPGPSNFICFAAPRAVPLVAPPQAETAVHLNRGDCDGPGWR